jgi:hypothetical protein
LPCEHDNGCACERNESDGLIFWLEGTVCIECHYCGKTWRHVTEAWNHRDWGCKVRKNRKAPVVRQTLLTDPLFGPILLAWKKG